MKLTNEYSIAIHRYYFLPCSPATMTFLFEYSGLTISITY